MLNRFRPPLKAALASVALGALVPLAACNQAVPEQSAYRLPDLPATLPLALGEERPIAKAPAASELPRARHIKAARIADPDDYYAYADDAWSYYDALGDAPPDYGFYYDGIEPWAWQGYDDSLMFVEPLDYGYRSYYYRPGEDYPYFIRDPYYGYGYDDGLLAIVYNALGGIVPYDDWYDYPYLDYASSYYDRGYDLYWASRYRHPVIAANWYAVQPAYNVAFLDWEEDLWRQPDWWDYHTRTFDTRDLYWREERERRLAEAVRYAAWQDLGFQAAPPPRAIPRNWRRADWASDERWFTPAVSGFVGDVDDQQRAARRERQRIASLARPTSEQDQVRLAELRQRVGGRPDFGTQRTERMAELRRDLDRRQVQLASRDDRSALRERAMLQRQERVIAEVQQEELRRGRGELRRDRSAENQRFAGVDRRQLRDSAREQRLARSQQNELRRGRGEFRRDLSAENQRFAGGDRRQLRDGQRQQRLERSERRRQDLAARGDVLQRRQFADEAGRQRGQQRAEVQQRRQAQLEARAQAEGQARAEAQQRREAQVRVRQQREQARAEAGARAAQREQVRSEARQRREEQVRVRQQREQARAEAGARAAQREQARQAVQQQRAAREQARAEVGARAAQREQARQAAQQQRAAREQPRAEAGARAAQREQARQAAQQQRADRQQQVAQAQAAPASDGGGGKEKRGRGHN